MVVPRHVHTKGKSLSRENRPFALTYLDGINALTNLGLRGTDYRVLLALIEQVVRNDSFLYSVKTAALILSVDPAQVSGAIVRLKDRGVLLHVGPERNRVIFNPHYLWIGDRPHRVLWQMELKRLHPQHMLWYAPSDEEREFIKEQAVQKSGQQQEENS